MKEKKKAPQGVDERRKHKRYDFKSSIWLEIAQGEQLKRLETINISRGGLRFHSQAELVRGATVILHIEIPYFLDLIRAECTVMNCHNEDAKKGYSVGVQIDHVSGVTQEQLETFLSELYDE